MSTRQPSLGLPADCDALDRAVAKMRRQMCDCFRIVFRRILNGHPIECTASEFRKCVCVADSCRTRPSMKKTLGADETLLEPNPGNSEVKRSIYGHPAAPLRPAGARTTRIPRRNPDEPGLNRLPVSHHRSGHRPPGRLDTVVAGFGHRQNIVRPDYVAVGYPLSTDDLVRRAGLR
jgi:hypothetical protein